MARSGSTSAAVLIVGELDGPEVGATVGVVEAGGRVGVAVGELDDGWLGTLGAAVGTEVGTEVVGGMVGVYEGELVGTETTTN